MEVEVSEFIGTERGERGEERLTCAVSRPAASTSRSSRSGCDDEWLVGRRHVSVDSLAQLLEELREQKDEEEVLELTAV